MPPTSSHELKNPLTSLRSAVETLPLAKNENSRSRLMEIIQHDVRRLDRLITDISDASRLDAELAREDAGNGRPEEIHHRPRRRVARGRRATRRRSRSSSRPPSCRKASRATSSSATICGIGQVITNLIENARSFVPEDRGHIAVSLARAGKFNIVTVDDNGPGIRADNIDRIFERFYTDRPAGEAFGQNSGLGLSISRQIVEAHGGTLTAENIPGTKPGEIKGARFVVTLPAEG